MGHHKSTSSNPNEFILPDLGEGVAEAELLKWRVKAGDRVNEHDILADMETDKAVVEVPSPRAGVILSLHGGEGEILKVGSVLVTYASDGTSAGSSPAATPAHVEAKPASHAAHAPAPKPSPAPPSNGSHSQSIAGATSDREDEGTVVGKMGGALAGISAAPGKALATPAVRRLARDLGVDIDRIAGTGIGGRVLEKDVRGASTSPKPASPSQSHAAPVTSRGPSQTVHAQIGALAPEATARSAAPSPAKREVSSIPPGQESVRIPFRGVRRTIANRLRESVNQAVHFNVMDEADASALDALRKKLASASGEKVSFLPFVCSAVCRVLTQEQFRPLNATVDEKPSEPGYEAAIIQHRAVHLGIAADTESGLMVPVVRDADAYGVLELGRHITHVADAARSRSATREQLMGSTFTISNVGSYAGRFATPIINYPECGILAVGRARPGPVVRTIAGVSGIFPGQLLPLSLACDHRMVDGATAAMALAEIVRLLQDAPESLLGPARG